MAQKSEYVGDHGHVNLVIASKNQDFSAPDPSKFTGKETAVSASTMDTRTNIIQQTVTAHSDGRLDVTDAMGHTKHEHISQQMYKAIEQAFQTGALDKVNGIVQQAEHHHGHHAHHGVAAHAPQHSNDAGKGR